MTAGEIYDLALRSGGDDFQAVTELLERLGEPWCLIGGLAVNVYCEPIYAADADFVIIVSRCAAAGLRPRCAAYDRSALSGFPAARYARRSVRRPMQSRRTCRLISR